jgi:hydroxymethylbilane synthase
VGDDGIVRSATNLKTLFTKEIEDALLDDRIDLAVHSMKDMPIELPEGLVIGAVPLREDPRDVWISREDRPFREVPAGARVATGAIRRQAQLRHMRPDLELVPLRGNVDTRLRKLSEGSFDGLVLALAGLKRLGQEKEVTEVFSLERLLPAVGQGALAIETRPEDRLVSYLGSMNHQPSFLAVQAERAFLKTLGGSCQTPIAAYAHLSDGQLVLDGLVASPDGRRLVRDVEKGPLDEASGIGARLAEKLLTSGAHAILFPQK